MSHLDVAPKDLRFRADTKRQATILYLSNKSDGRVAFKVKTTAPKRYCVKPSAEVVEPSSTMEVKVFMQNSKDITAAVIADCKDKFLIQSTPVPPDWTMKTDDTQTAELFNRKTNSSLYEEKLKVTLEAPPPPPSPVPEGSEALEAGSPASNAVSAGLNGAGPHPTGPGGVPVSTRAVGTAQPLAGGTGTGRGAAGAGAVPTSGDADLRTENRHLREQLALLQLKSGEAAAKVGSGGAGGAAAASGSLGAPESHITLLHLVLVAVVAYILGVYLS